MPPVEIHLWIKSKSLDSSIWSWWNNEKVWVLKENEKDNSVYAKFKNGKFIFHILWIDDILLTSSNVKLPLEKKKSLSSSFNVNDLSEALLVLGIEIHRDRWKWVLGLSQIHT